MGGGLSSEAMLAAWEAGARRGPLDRALMLLWAGGQGEGAADLALVERDRRLLHLRRATFGGALDSVATCPGCGARVEVSVDADALARMLPPPDAAPVRIGGREVVLRPLTSRDIAAAGLSADAAAELRRRLGDGHDLPAEAAPALDEMIETQAAAAELSCTLACPECGAEWQDSLDIGAHFWAEVEAAALGTLAEVAELARAFGWTEPEVLALSPARRAAYLGLAREGP